MLRLSGIGAILLACASLHAATLQQLSLDEMTQASTVIVRARVTSASAAFTGPTIYTHYKLDVSETWKGAAVSELMIPGGVASGYRQSYPGVPTLQSGSEYVLFLWTSQKTGITHLVGLSQGLYNVTKQTDGAIQVSRPTVGETMLDAKGRHVADQPVQMRLADMKRRVNRPTPAGARQ
jgi:hypothetical protein